MQYWHGPSPIPFPEVIPNPDVHLGVVTIATKQILVVVLAIVLMVVLRAFVYRTKLGKAMRATAQDRDAAQLMGIDINTTIALTFLIGSALAGAAGFVSGVYYGSTWAFAGLKAFTAAVLGGIGNLTGAMLGGFLIGLIEAMTTQLISDQWSNVVVFSVLVLVLIFRPSGLLGESLPAKV
jgi:branched-chain amino acid transport system permease protein